MPRRLLNSCFAEMRRDLLAIRCLSARVLLLVVTSTICSGCQNSENVTKNERALTDKNTKQDDHVPEDSLRATGERRAATPDDWFEDVTSSSGLSFVHSSGRNANVFTMVEAFGSGVALLDYDADGDLDVFCVGGGTISEDLVFAGSPNQLFRNDGDFRFSNVTSESGLDVPVDYSHGVTVGDINNDSLPDLFISCFGRSRLFLNRGQGRFEDRTQFMKPELTGWNTACCFADVTNDGLLDLFVTGYLKWTPNAKERCVDPRSGLRDVCMPGSFPGDQAHLYVGTVDGTFIDATEGSGLLSDGKGLECGHWTLTGTAIWTSTLPMTLSVTISILDKAEESFRNQQFSAEYRAMNLARPKEVWALMRQMLMETAHRTFS
ncbi:MAG: VCBS repeat-containing protein [Planctomycetaceae bacterium]